MIEELPSLLFKPKSETHFPLVSHSRQFAANHHTMRLKIEFYYQKHLQTWTASRAIVAVG